MSPGPGPGSGPAAVGWQLDARVVDAASIPAIVLGLEGRAAYVNAATAAITGAGIAPEPGADIRGCLFADEEVATVEHALAMAGRGETWTGRLLLHARHDPAGRRVQTIWTSVQAVDGENGVLLVLAEHPDQRAAGVLGGRLKALAALSAALLDAPDVAAVTQVVVEQLAEVTGASVASLSVLVDTETFALLGLRGGRPGAASRWATYPLAASTPVGDAVRMRAPLLLSGEEEIQRRYPDLESASSGERSLVCLPLLLGDEPLGAASLTFPGPRRIDADELEFLATLGDYCAQALARLRASEAAADREAKVRFLGEASAELASDLDYEKTLRRVAELAVPWFADWCSIALLQDGVLRTLKVAHNDPLNEPLIQELLDHYPPQESAPHGPYEVIRSGQSNLLPEVPDELLVATAQDERHLEIMRTLQLRSALAVPLRAGDRVSGVITWVTGEHGRRFGPEDVAFGEDLAQRAGVAIDNAELHSQLRDSALRLQRAVLPGELATPPGTEVAARYLPAGRSGTGGDFYDLLPLDDGRICLFVGDVMGRGVEAASVMAQMRSAVRTLAAVDPRPVRVMAGLDRVFEQWHLEQLVSVAYVVLDLEAGTLSVVNAGHPPPVVVRLDGEAVEIETEASLILGAGGGRRSVTTAPFAEGDTVLLYTDGLVERRGEGPEEGLARLTRACAVFDGRALPASLDAVVAMVRDPSRDDDVALLAVRRTGPATVRG